MTLRMPNRPRAPVTFTISDLRHWNVFARSQLALDAESAAVVRWEPYDNNNLGQKMRGLARFAHTGELFGWTGQALAGGACVGGVFLVGTGLSLAVRRLFGWRLWQRLRSPQVASALGAGAAGGAGTAGRMGAEAEAGRAGGAGVGDYGDVPIR